VQDFCEKIYIENKVCDFSTSAVSVRKISRSKNNSALCYHCTKLVFAYTTGSSLIFEWKFDFLHKFRKIFKQSNLWKSVQCKPYCSMRSDTTKLTVTFATVRTGRKYPRPNVCKDNTKYFTWLNGICSILRYQLPLYWPCNINRTEQSGNNDKTVSYRIMFIYMYQNTLA